ncbi:DUF4232 domain-containing protein [Streptomyces sp. NPDC050095]|uniref:DUF4232 domain-containing protein n=1 Tax=unclassified Streptomyces TaxID=2593676 RepID=UPI003429536E
MRIRGSGRRAALARLAGAVAGAALLAGCGTASTTPAGAAEARKTYPGGVHAESLDPSKFAQYGEAPQPKDARQPTASPAPTSTSSSTSSPTVCPASGTRITAGRGDAAMGLRVLDLTLTNCGSTTVELYGYPRLTPQKPDGTPVERVRVLEGTDGITTGVDAGPRRITLRPGESAVTDLVWRNTYDDTTHPPVTVDQVVVDPRPARGTATVIPDPPLDLGSTGRLGTTAWHRAQEAAAGR